MHRSTTTATLAALTTLATTCVGCKRDSPLAEPPGRASAASPALSSGAPATSTPTPPINPTVDTCNVTPPTTVIAAGLLESCLPCTVVATPPFDLPLRAAQTLIDDFQGRL